jgi:hypothetical protein
VASILAIEKTQDGLHYIDPADPGRSRSLRGDG